VVDGLLDALGIESSSEVVAAVRDRLGAGRGPTRRAGLDAVAEAAVWAEVADEAAHWRYSPG
jgi:hypothetical protein